MCGRELETLPIQMSVNGSTIEFDYYALNLRACAVEYVWEQKTVGIAKNYRLAQCQKDLTDFFTC